MPARLFVLSLLVTLPACAQRMNSLAPTDRAKLTPTDSDNAIVATLYKIFAVLGVKVPAVK
jgi:hypothetical protein